MRRVRYPILKPASNIKRRKKMRSKKFYLGFDLGASSGRAVLGLLEGGKLSTTEINRFLNGPVKLAGTLYWDIACELNKVLHSQQHTFELKFACNEYKSVIIPVELLEMCERLPTEKDGGGIG